MCVARQGDVFLAQGSGYVTPILALSPAGEVALIIGLVFMAFLVFLFYVAFRVDRFLRKYLDE